MPRLQRSLAASLVALLAVASAAAGAFRIEVLAGLPAGAPAVAVEVRYTFDCTGTMPRVISGSIGPGPLTAVAVAAALETIIDTGPGNQSCSTLLRGLDAMSGGTASVNVTANDPADGEIHTFQTTTGPGLSLKVTTLNGNSAKASTPSGVGAGGTVEVNVNPVVTVVTVPGQSASSVVLALSAQLTGLGFPHAVVPISGSQCLLDPQAINSTLYLCFPGDANGTHGVGLTSRDPGFRGVSQTTAITAPDDCICAQTSTVPALGTWGLIVLGSLVAAAGVLIVLRRQA